MNIIVQLVLVVLISHQVCYGAAVGLSTNVTNLCSGGCDWNTPAIWGTNSVPGNSDAVTINVGGSYTIHISSAVNISSLDMGAQDSNKQALEITSGAVLSVSGTVTGEYSSIFQVDTAATFNIGQQATFYGSLIVAGYVYGAVGVHIGTYDSQNPLNIVYGKLQLNGGTLNVPISVTVSSQSSIVGSGTIATQSLSTDGDTEPGGSGSVGSIFVDGDLVLSSSSDVYIDVGSDSSFDHINISGNFNQDGTLVVNLLGSYTPYQTQQFAVFNYSDQSNGFSTVHGTNPILPNFLNKDWIVRVRTDCTLVQYGSANTLSLSVFVFVIVFSAFV